MRLPRSNRPNPNPMPSTTVMFPRDFYDALEAGQMNASMLDSCDAQLASIAAKAPKKPKKNAPYDVDAFVSDALLWAYQHPSQAWSAATESVFATVLKRKKHGTGWSCTDRLLCAWTRHSTYMPRADHHGVLRAHMNQGHANGQSKMLPLVGPLPSLLQFAPQDAQREWLEAGVDAAQNEDSLSIELMALLYFHGEHNKLSRVQQREVNVALLGVRGRAPMPFSCIEGIHGQHPNAGALQSSLLRLTLKMACNPLFFPEYQVAGKNQCREYLQPWLQKNPLPTDPILRSECLLAAAFLEQHAPEWIDPDVWKAQAPQEWAHVQAALPVLLSLHNVAWSPYDSERVVDALALLLAPTLGLNGQESAPLPALWDKCDLVQ